jgi:aminoglycoside 2''-phosphotransferase
MPDLEIEQFEINQEGLVNDVVIVNNSLVFRFAKNAKGAEILELETKILDLIRPRIHVDLPAPVCQGDGWIVYPFLEGQPLLRETILGLDANTQTRVAGQLGQFLHEVHATALSNRGWQAPSTRAPVTRQAWLERYARIKEKVYRCCSGIKSAGLRAYSTPPWTIPRFSPINPRSFTAIWHPTASCLTARETRSPA